jgi:nitrite reductase/ring-hydroxylating ferredoxin subunit
VIVTVGVAEVPAGRPLAVRVSDTLTLAVCELEGAYLAFDGKCPHRGALLGEGVLEGGLLVCPLHHFKFDLAKGGRCVMPKHLKLKSFPVVREGERLSIDVRDAAEPAAADTARAGMPAPAR